MSELRRNFYVGVAGCGLLLTGCANLKPKPVDHYVFVTAKQATLRDRVAAVSNRTGAVANGDKLKVLDHARHFVKVQSPKGDIGWIKEQEVATEETTVGFDKLQEAHAKDPQVATAVIGDEVYMHLKPGRETERFYLLNEKDKVELLRRATLQKATTAGSVAKVQKAIPQAAGSDATRKDLPPVEAAKAASLAEPPSFEDWWLVRTASGHIGWVYARKLEVDAPEALTRYAEGQRFVGAYLLTTIHDDGAEGDLKDIPIYVTVLSPYKSGLPYDFDQVRVFTWSTKSHRYETGFRQKNIEGFLPVTITHKTEPDEKGQFGTMNLPEFTFNVLASDAGPVLPDADTGEMKPGKTISQTFRLEGNTLRRIGPTVPGDAVAHPAAEVKKEKKGKKK